MSKKHIEECVRESLQGYFRDLGGETPVGPVFVGIGRGSGNSVNAYLVIGAP